MAVVVEVLVTRNCPQEDAAINLVGIAANAVGVRPRVELIEISDLDQAEQHDFVGSPTIRVNGRDVDPPAIDAPTSLSCRHYETGHGHSAVPDVEQLRASLLDAAAASDATGAPGRSWRL
jgi:hypothetical protein